MKPSVSTTRFFQFNAWRTRLSAWALLLTAVSTALADLDFGPMSLSHKPARALNTTGSLSKALARAPRIGFVGRVGGVAFDAEAAPAAEFTVKSLGMDYDAAKPDGTRLALKLNGKAVSAPIYDWQLIPIAKYADGKTTSCFTLFGKLEAEEEAETLLQDGARILNYDKAFEDTLLGLRLFQMDVMLLDDAFATELPRDSGKFLLGSGEKEPDVAKNEGNLEVYQRERARVIARGRSEEKGFPTDFHSYVICDQFVPIKFSVAEGSLVITGEPRYYFWKGNEQEVMTRFLTEEAIKLGLVAKGTDPSGLMLELMLKTAGLTGEEEKAFEKKMEAAAEAARKRIDDARDDDSVVSATYLEVYSNEHAKLAKRLEAVNPPVWHATRNTMRYGAFFRYVKAKHPATWAAFMKGVASAELKPPLPGFKTPTVMKLRDGAER